MARLHKKNGLPVRRGKKDRPDFTALFPFIDWDNDGKITEAEYEVFDVQIKSYTDGSYPKTNEQAKPEWQVFKRLAAEAPKKLHQKLPHLERPRGIPRKNGTAIDRP